MKACEAIELLSDGVWHEVKDLQEKLGLNDFKTKLLIEFLVNYDFCLLTGVNGREEHSSLCRVMNNLYPNRDCGKLVPEKVKLKPNMLTFLQELDKIEEGK